MIHLGVIPRAAIGVAAAVSLLAVAPSASARWNVHDDEAATQVLPPPGGTEDQACASRVRGQSGWVAFEDPQTYVPDPATTSAYNAVPYEVWKAPDGFTSFDAAVAEYDENLQFVGFVFTDEAGNEFRATEVGGVDGRPHRLLDDPIPTDSEGEYVFTVANYSIPLASSVRPGDVVLVRAGFSDPVLLADQTVVDCSFATRGVDFRAKVRSGFTRTVATFEGPGRAEDYTASVRWKDGTSASRGEIRQVDGRFIVVGSHRYANAGRYAVQVTVKQKYTQTSQQALSGATISRS